MSKIFYILPLFVSFVLFSCGGKQGRTAGEVAALDSVRYAAGFTITGYDGYTLAEINDPWDSTKILQRYILVNRESPVPSGLPQGALIRVPIQNIAVYSAVHVAIIEELGEADRIIGVCEPQYIKSPVIHEGLKSGRVANLGESTAPNVERIIDSNVEVIISSPFQNSGYGAVGKLGIPIVEGVDYMESDPLGRAEWIRFYGLLFGKMSVSDSLFRETEQRYLALKELVVSSVTERPSVLAEKRYGATWFVPGGDSYVVKVYEDAGAEYIFRNAAGTGSLPMSFESVLDQAIHADFWLFKYNDSKDITYANLRQEYTPYANFDAFKNKTVYAMNGARVSYYEEMPIHPDYLLEDLIKIFHPDLLPAHSLRYFHPLGE